MTFKQDQRLISMLLDMQRCRHLEQFAIKGSDDVCRNTIYNPSNGYIPRAFGGAKCTLEDVKLVIVSNGPTDPIDNESYSGSPEEDLSLLLADRYLTSEPLSIHTNLRSFLNLVFPDLAGPLEMQLTRVWVTNSVHCTFSENVKIAERRRCARANLSRHIELFSNPAVVLAGSQPKKISRQLSHAFPDTQVIKCHSFSSPFPNGKSFAEESWCEAAKRVRAQIEGCS